MRIAQGRDAEFSFCITPLFFIIYEQNAAKG